MAVTFRVSPNITRGLSNPEAALVQGQGPVWDSGKGKQHHLLNSGFLYSRRPQCELSQGHIPALISKSKQSLRESYMVVKKTVSPGSEGSSCSLWCVCSDGPLSKYVSDSGGGQPCGCLSHQWGTTWKFFNTLFLPNGCTLLSSVTLYKHWPRSLRLFWGLWVFNQNVQQHDGLR